LRKPKIGIFGRFLDVCAMSGDSADPVLQAAKSVAPYGSLRRYVPKEASARAIGTGIIRDYLAQREPTPQQVALLLDTLRAALAAAQQAADAKAALRQARAAQRPCAKLRKVPIPRPALLFSRSSKGRWRGQRVALLDSFTVATEGSA
jgi:hypothetical protein